MINNNYILIIIVSIILFFIFILFIIKSSRPSQYSYYIPSNYNSNSNSTSVSINNMTLKQLETHILTQIEFYRALKYTPDEIYDTLKSNSRIRTYLNNNPYILFPTLTQTSRKRIHSV